MKVEDEITIEDIEGELEKIKECAALGSCKVAQGLENFLYYRFVKFASKPKSNVFHLAKMAKLILKTKDIDFVRGVS